MYEFTFFLLFLTDFIMFLLFRNGSGYPYIYNSDGFVHCAGGFWKEEETGNPY